MVRTQISLTQEQHDRLTQRAARDGISMSSFVRDAVDRALGPRENAAAALAEAARTSTFRAPPGTNPDLDSLYDELDW